MNYAASHTATMDNNSNNALADGIRIGGIGNTLAGVMAERAAKLIVQAGEPMAISVEPSGAVLVEPAESAMPDDIVGVYSPDDPTFGLPMRIIEDLKWWRMQRRAAA